VRALLINPWIHDFAAYDMWCQPLGLLYVADLLERLGCGTTLVNCLDRTHPSLHGWKAEGGWFGAFGCGKYPGEVIEKPAPLAGLKRKLRRYGIPLDAFRREIAAVDKPDLICVTTLMTHWHGGAIEAIREAKRLFPATPVVLGGMYPTFCAEHARRNSGADAVVSGGSFREVAGAICGVLGVNGDGLPGGWEGIKPAHHLIRSGAAGIVTSWGCPFRCAYCGSRLIHDSYVQRPPRDVADELEWLAREGGRRDVAFYDDALLVNAERHFLPIAEEIITRELYLRFHTPNGLHCRYMTPEIAKAMRRCGFRTVRLSYESSDAGRQIRESSGKVTDDEFIRAVGALKSAGFESREIAAYVLFGLPGQEAEEIRRSVRRVIDEGIQASLAQFSPIPGTSAYEEWLAASTYSREEAESEPLCYSCSAIGYRMKSGPDWEGYESLKNEVRRANLALITRADKTRTAGAAGAGAPI